MRFRWERILLRLGTALLLLAGTAVGAEKPRYVVIVPVANMYSGPTQDSDVVSQVIYASGVGVLEEQQNWIKIRTLEDDYTGWVERSVLRPLGESPAYASTGEVVEVSALMSNIYREPDVTTHAPILTVPFETRLEVVTIKSDEERWIEVRLPDGRRAWIQRGDVVRASAAKTAIEIPAMVELGKRFLGLPYTWGGRSSFGYDCSGFVQMLMRRRGYFIPRDADIQAAWTGFVPVELSALRAGDTLYFGSEGKITHTGMFIGDGQFIHATTHDHPVIQISPMDDHWKKLFVGARRVKP